MEKVLNVIYEHCVFEVFAVDLCLAPVNRCVQQKPIRLEMFV